MSIDDLKGFSSGDGVAASIHTDGSEGAQTTHLILQVLINQDSQDLDTLINDAILRQLMEMTGGNKTRIARLLGVSLKTVYNRLNALQREDQ